MTAFCTAWNVEAASTELLDRRSNISFHFLTHKLYIVFGGHGIASWTWDIRWKFVGDKTTDCEDDVVNANWAMCVLGYSVIEVKRHKVLTLQQRKPLLIEVSHSQLKHRSLISFLLDSSFLEPVDTNCTYSERLCCKLLYSDCLLLLLLFSELHRTSILMSMRFQSFLRHRTSYLRTFWEAAFAATAFALTSSLSSTGACQQQTTC